jgi:hypothetical protein
VALEHRNLKNNWSTTLQADAAAADTTLSILQAMLDKLVSPNPSSTEWYMLTLDDGVQAPEIVRCTGKGSGTATVVRSQEGTSAPTTWAAGTKVEIRITAQLLRVLESAQYDDAAEVLAIGFRAGRVLNAGLGTVLFGYRAGEGLTTGDNNVAIGAWALQSESTGSGNTALGHHALSSIAAASSDNIGIGVSAGEFVGNLATKNTFIGNFTDKGSGAPANLSGTICLGYGATVYSNNVASIGSSSARLSEVYIGGGQRDTAAAQVTLAASAGSGTDKAGGTLRLGGGKGTGTGAGGKVIIATAPTGGVSGSTEAAWTDRAEWDNTGLLWTYAGLKTGDPGLGAGIWKLGTVQAGAVTLDTANYVEVDIGGTVVKLLKAA